MARVAEKPVAYLAQLEAATGEDRAAHGKRELKTATKEIEVSRTDRDSGYMVRDGKPKGFFDLDHAPWTANHDHH
jgi:hypothetical protein